MSCRPDHHDVGGFRVDLADDRFTVTSPGGATLGDVALLAGAGEAVVDMQFGAFAVTGESRDLRTAGRFRRRDADPALVLEVEGADGEPFGTLTFTEVDPTALAIDFVPAATHDRIGLSAACGPEGPYLGLGSHAMDLDHRGEAFPLWTSEPGVGKSADDQLPDAWPLEGARHATSFPAPWVLRPGNGDGLLLDTQRRVDADLCATDADRVELVAWDDGPLHLVWITEARPLDTVRHLTDLLGRAPLPPPWVFGAWGDAIRGPERVRTVKDELRANGVPATLVWSEDWKGATETPTGYRLGEEWFLDREIYPDAEALAAELDDAGLKWLAYFAPFLGEDTDTWDEAVAADVIVKNEAGEPYLFPGVTFAPTALLDVSTDAGRAFAIERMRAALDLGFDGWMADYGEWLPADAVLANGMTGLEAHASYPEWWHETNLEAIAGADATFFVRSGWTRTAGSVPVVWAGDQRTDFATDDGFPTVLPLGLGLSASGVPVFTHDVAGYQSVGNPPSDLELWFRWAELGAFSPIFRLHHGSFDTDNWQFDSSPETLAHYAALAREHVRLFPYRYGLAARAAADGTPMILPVGFVFDGEDLARADAWMLGSALLVAPVTERGATSRDVDLPSAVRWWDWWTLTPATSGRIEAPLEKIPVFAAERTTVPTFATIPDTLVDRADGLLGLADVDGERVVYLFGGGGTFVEADGTTYTPSGDPTGPGEVEITAQTGTAEVAGVTVAVDGPIPRTYRFVVP